MYHPDSILITHTMEIHGCFVGATLVSPVFDDEEGDTSVAPTEALLSSASETTRGNWLVTVGVPAHA